MITNKHYIHPEDGLANQLLINASSHESQALLVLALEPGIPHAPEDMVAAIDDVVPEGASAWYPSQQRPIAGLLSSRAEGMLTSRGATLGKAMAASALQLADEQNVSLGALWGPVLSGEAIRGPFARFLLVRQLLEQGTRQTPLRLEQQLPLKQQSIQRHLTSMAADGLIEYNCNVEPDDLMYGLRDKAEPLPPTTRKVSRTLHAYLKTNREAGFTELVDHYRSIVSATNGPLLTDTELSQHVFSSMDELYSYGALHTSPGQPTRHHIGFTTRQRALWEATVDAVNHVVTADPAEQQRLAGQGQDFLTDQAAMLRTLQRMRRSQRRVTLIN